MKKLITVLAALLLCLSLAGCGSGTPERQVAPGAPPWPEDCPLEFWIADSVVLADFDGHDEVDGLFGGWEYLGKGYHTVKDEAGIMNVRPDVCVTYVITNYPDYSSPGAAVTTIVITDPAVTLYGLTMDSPLEEWDAVMQKMGFEISDLGGDGVRHHAERDGFWFSYGGGGEIRINAEVTNEHGIQF